MEEEEEKKYYGQGLRQDIIGATEDYFSKGAEGLRQLSSDPVQGAQTVAVTGLTSNLLGNLKPGVVGSAAEKQMFNRGTASLMNPAYRKLLGQGIIRQGAQVAGIPVTAAVIAGDTVLAKAAEAQAEMQRMSDIEESQMEKAGSDLAERLRRLNLIEEQKAFDEGRAPFGGEEGITMGNLDEYFAANPDFSGIGNVQLPGEEPRVAPVVQQAPMAPTGIDYSSAFSGGQQQTPAPTESQFSSLLGNLANQGVSADDRAAIAGQMLRGMGTVGRDATNAAIFQRARDEYAAKYGADSLKPKVGFDTETSVSGSQGGLTMGDYRNILREKGIGGSAQFSLAKQMLEESQLGKQKGQLESDLLRAQIEKAQRPEKGRAPSAIEIQAATIQQLIPIQQKLEAGIPISAEEEALYRSGSTLINLQQRAGDFGADPAFKDIASYQQQEVADATVLPSATDPDGIKMIEQVMSTNPGKSKEQVIASLKKANKIS